MSIDPRRLADSYFPQFGTPWVPLLPREQLQRMTIPQLVEYQEARRAVEDAARQNPTGAGWTLPSWRKVMENFNKYPIHCILGGVRSSKSSFAARLCVWGLGNFPEAEIRCYHVNKDRSKQDQQPFIWDALPQGLKTLPTQRGKSHSIQFTQANGFTNNVLILPPLEGYVKGGRIDFSNYASFEDDERTAEGFRAQIIWLDEESPVKLFETLTYRTTDFHGRIILTFTTLDGWTPLVQDILGKTKTLEWRYSDLVKRKVPVLQESLSRKGCLIHYFWTEDNPFIDSVEFRKKLDGRSEDEILARAHGIPTKAAKAAFPLFDRAVNVVKHDDLPFIKNPNYPVTRYMVIDPAGSRNWAILWIAVDTTNTWWIYREWPDHETFGQWAEPGPTIHGKAGPAQRSIGYGIKEYVELIHKLEGDEVIFERLIDPRMGAAEKQSADHGATTIISDLERHDLTVIPAPGVDQRNGEQMLANYISWNPNKPRDSMNAPHYYVSERCENHIHCMSEYPERCPIDAAIRDFVDVARYAAVANIIFVAVEDMQGAGTTGSY